MATFVAGTSDAAANAATNFINNTTATAFVPNIWSKMALVARETAMVWAGAVNRMFESELTVGDRIHVPNISNIGAARDITHNSVTNYINAITYTSVTEGGQTIVVDSHEYQAIAIESLIKLQANRDLMAAYTGKIGFSLGVSFDRALANLSDELGVTNGFEPEPYNPITTRQRLGSATASLTADDLLNAMRLLNERDVPKSERCIIVSPAQSIGFISFNPGNSLADGALAKAQTSHNMFVNRDYDKYMSKFSDHPGMGEAYVTSWMGVPIFESNLLWPASGSNGHSNAMFHKDAITAVMQMSPKTHHHFDIDYIADKVVVEQVYGVDVLRADHGVELLGL